jgi:hypothetical protein
VVEVADLHVRPPGPDEGGHELQLVVVHPHAAALGDRLHRGIREPLVDLPVGVPPLAVELRRHDDVVVQRPQRPVRHALVVELDLVGRQVDRDEVHALGVERLEGGGVAGRAGPADPGCIGRAHDRRERGDQPAGGAAPPPAGGVGADAGLVGVLVVDGIDRETVGHHHEVVAAVVTF